MGVNTIVAPSFEERTEAVERIIQALIDDLISEVDKNLAGWRTAEELNISDDVLTILRRERVVFGNIRFRLNLEKPDKIGERYRSLKLKLDQMSYFYQNYEHNQQKIQNKKYIIVEFENLRQLINDKVFTLTEFATLGFWKLLSITGISAPIDDIINQGYSPRDWAIISYSAIPQLVEDLFYNEHSKGEILQTFKKAHEKKILSSASQIEYLNPEKIEQIKNIIQWDILKSNLTQDTKLFLGFIWFPFLVIDEKSYTVYFEDGSSEVLNALNELITSFFGKSLNQVIYQINQELTQPVLSQHWFSEVVTLPEVV